MFRLLTFGLDRSSQERGDIFLSGLNSIKENWFFGDYMGDVAYRMKPGKYIHNIFCIFIILSHIIYNINIRIVFTNGNK